MQEFSTRKTLEELRKEIDRTVNYLRKDRLEKGGREVSLVITKLQEARLWAGEALKEIGHFDN